MVLEPLVGAQRLDHLQRRQGAVLEGHAGVHGLGALLVGGQPHQAGEHRRGRRAVVDRGDVAPPGLGPCKGGGVVAAGEDALAVATRAEAGVKVDPAQPAAALAVLAQHLAQREVAPGGRRAAVEDAAGVVVLAARDGLLQGALAVRLHVGAEPGRGRRVGGPDLGHDEVGDVVVGRVARRLGGEIVEVAVEVDVLVRRPPPPGEAPWVEAMDVEHGHAGLAGGAVPGLVFEEGNLHARAAEALDPVAGAADHEQRLGMVGAVTDHVHGQHLAVAAGQRVHPRLDAEPAQTGRGLELLARLLVGLRKGGCCAQDRATLSAPGPARLRRGGPRACRRAESGRR